MAEAYAAFTSPRRADASAYLTSLLALLAGNLLLLSSALVLSGLLILLIAILVIDGFGKILTVWRKPRAVRVPTVVNGLVDFGCAALLWYLNRIIGTEQAIGIVVGAYIAAAGWRMLMAPAEAATPDAAAAAPSAHPDPGLGLAPNETFARLARAGRQHGADGACHRSHVDADAWRRVPRDPPRPDADSGQPARHQSRPSLRPPAIS